MKNNKLNSVVLFIFLLALTTTGFAQNRGNDLGFHNLGDLQIEDAFSASLPAAKYNISSGINGVFSNPAALSTVKKLTLSLSYGNSTVSWRENQEYRPNRLFVNLPFYLEGLYVPDPSTNDSLDWQIFSDGLLDTLYQVAEPALGLDPYGSQAADWEKKHSAAMPTHFAAALPLMNERLILSFGYGSVLNASTYDRNKTWLDPHLGYKAYNMPEMVNGTDTLHMDWFDFERFADVSLNEMALAGSWEVSEHLSLGAGLSLYSGTSSEVQTFNKVGYFKLIDDNEFSFSYDTLNTEWKADADWSGNIMRAGLSLDYDKIAIGLSWAGLGKMSKEYDIVETVQDTNGIRNTSYSESIENDLPLELNGSLLFRPHEKFDIHLAFGSKDHSSMAAAVIETDTLATTLTDQLDLSFGAEYRPFRLLALRAGYKSSSSSFVPDGAPIKDVGPKMTTLSFGLGINLGNFGVLNAAWRIAEMQYSDIYSTNTNFNSVMRENIVIGYTFKMK